MSVSFNNTLYTEALASIAENIHDLCVQEKLDKKEYYRILLNMQILVEGMYPTLCISLMIKCGNNSVMVEEPFPLQELGRNILRPHFEAVNEVAHYSCSFKLRVGDSVAPATVTLHPVHVRTNSKGEGQWIINICEKVFYIGQSNKSMCYGVVKAEQISKQCLQITHTDPLINKLVITVF